jgi:hypothetical protein
MRRPIICFFIFCFAACAGASAQKQINVLFLGNSLTYYNNLPELVKLIAACDSVELTYRSISLPNYALVDHWNEGNAQKEIESGLYQYVVVQQGPSSQTEGRTYLLDYGLKFDSLIDRNNAKLVSYMVWPAKARFSDFAEVYESYKLLADSAKGISCAAGKAWLEVWKNYPEFKLYGDDNFHPDYRGSLLAALVIYGSIMQKSDLSFADYNKLKGVDLIKSDFKILVRAAQRTVAEQR